MTSGKPFTVQEVNEAWAAVTRNKGNKKKAARELGVPRQTLYRRLAIDATPSNTAEIELPKLPSSELPVDELIDQACLRFEKKEAYTKARRWFEIKVNSDKPIGVVFMGDPHIDDGGTNWPLLREHSMLRRYLPACHDGGDVRAGSLGP